MRQFVTNTTQLPNTDKISEKISQNPGKLMKILLTDTKYSKIGYANFILMTTGQINYNIGNYHY
jgi:hypothetical protein